MYDIHMGPIYIMALLFWQVLHHWLDCVTDCAWIPKRLKQLYSARSHVSVLGSRSTHSIL